MALRQAQATYPNVPIAVVEVSGQAARSGSAVSPSWNRSCGVSVRGEREGQLCLLVVESDLRAGAHPATVGACISVRPSVLSLSRW